MQNPTAPLSDARTEQFVRLIESTNPFDGCASADASSTTPIGGACMACTCRHWMTQAVFQDDIAATPQWHGHRYHPHLAASTSHPVCGQSNFIAALSCRIVATTRRQTERWRNSDMRQLAGSLLAVSGTSLRRLEFCLRASNPSEQSRARRQTESAISDVSAIGQTKYARLWRAFECPVPHRHATRRLPARLW